jgi:type VI protein secretion system component Hcp
MAEESTDLFFLLMRSKTEFVAGESMDRKLSDRGMEISEFEVSFGESNDLLGERDFKKLTSDLKGKNVDRAVVEAIEELRETQIKELTKARERYTELQAAGQIAADESQKFSIKKVVDWSSTGLLTAYNDSCANKKFLFPYAGVRSYRSGGSKQPYLSVTFGVVRMLTYKLSMSDPLPTEDIDFSFGQVQIQYWPQKWTGEAGLAATYAWDFIKKDVWKDAPRDLTVAKTRFAK